MTRLLAILMVAFGSFALGGLVGSAVVPDPPTLAPGYGHARTYADQCGGFVTDPYGAHGGPYVEGCDR